MSAASFSSLIRIVKFLEPRGKHFTISIKAAKVGTIEYLTVFKDVIHASPMSMAHIP